MNSTPLAERLEDLLRLLRTERPSAWRAGERFRELAEWKARNSVPGLWEKAPLIVTATLDDGWGNGLRVIELCAEVAGLRVRPLGLLKTPEQIIDECRGRVPEFLGLTVLQFDSEDALRSIALGLPESTKLLAGGPVFTIDPEFSERTGVQFVARNVADFLEYILAFSRGAADADAAVPA